MKSRPPIAVVGMAGLFPGAPDLRTFWQNIINKVDSTCEVPPDRWIAAPDAMYHPEPTPDKAFSKRACLIRNFKFQAEGFDLDKDLLKALDPLYHVILHVGREAFSSCVTSSLNKERIGTVLAAIALPTDASSAITREIFGRAFEQELFKNSGLGVAQHSPPIADRPLSKTACLASKVTSLPAAILARALGLGGGSYTLDAACASSLYAVKLACDELHAHRADAMLAGGVSRPECLYTQVGFSQLRALSPSGRCAPFDRSADGLVVGEGAGILVLKRLEDALRDGDTVHGLIRGIGLSNDMRGNLLAPDAKGQVRAMRSAYASAAWSPFDLDLIECHGAGTPVGDTTELHSLRTLWDASGWSPGQCAIGSVKSNVGHLLTGAGAAGMIKTLLALNHRILPPSLNFSQPPEKSPLIDSPFRVQTTPKPWSRRDKHLPLKAAVSAFGFGGINGHLLFEEWHPDAAEGWKTAISPPKPATEGQEAASTRQHAESTVRVAQSHTEDRPPIAIVGMEAAFGSLTGLRDFQEAVLSGTSIIGERPELRWKGAEQIAGRYLGSTLRHGGFMDQVSLDIGAFRIPPNEIPDMLPQQLLMLKIAAGAMKDAELPLREERPHMGVIIGVGFDFETTNFHLRWNLHNAMQAWCRKLGIDLDAEAGAVWLESLRDAWGPPLTPTRTLGALASIVASRIAKEFRSGGPSFAISGEEASGLRALEIGVRSLQLNETDVVLVGAIDLNGDVRSVITAHQITPFSQQNRICPFDRTADGTLPGEGAAALVLKRLDQAMQDGDRIYAVIKGLGNANGGGIDMGTSSADGYIHSLKRAFDDAGLSPSSIGYIETHGSGTPSEDDVESEALHAFFGNVPEFKAGPCAIGSVKPNIGHAGAAAGLASLVKTSLCLYQEILPPLKNFVAPAREIWQRETFHLPAYSQYWARNRQDGPRRACAAAMTADGTCMHVILEGFEYEGVNAAQYTIPEKVRRERQRPLGPKPFGLFVVEGDSREKLIDGLNALERHLRTCTSASGKVGALAGKIRPAEEMIEPAARSWYFKTGLDPHKRFAVSLVAGSIPQLEKWIADACKIVSSDDPPRLTGPGIHYSRTPLGPSGQVAFVFPGSGNHYVGLGREIGLRWPEILRALDAGTQRLKDQLRPRCYVPQRVSWQPGWEQEALEILKADPLNMIFGQVVYGGVMTHLIKRFGLEASAVIGYSLGESAGLFALGAWPDRGAMLERMQHTDLFTEQLGGPCHAARQAWNVPPDEAVDWCAASVNRSAGDVRDVIQRWDTTRLLIVNTRDECVIGGRRPHVEAAIEALGCEAIFLDDVVTVHCDAATPVKEAYRELHLFPTSSPENIRFYSCARGRSYELTRDGAAASILKQALEGFDFTKTVEQAYTDGIRIFVEMGPHSSCTRMIRNILREKPHLAVSACARGEDDYLTVLKCLGALIAERVPVTLEALYGRNAYTGEIEGAEKENPRRTVNLIIGGQAPHPTLPETKGRARKREPVPQFPEVAGARKAVFSEPAQSSQATGARDNPRLSDKQPAVLWDDRLSEPNHPYSELIGPMTRNVEVTADAHRSFLDFSEELTKGFAQTFAFQTRLLETMLSDSEAADKVFGHEQGRPRHGQKIARKPRKTEAGELSHRGMPKLRARNDSGAEPVFDRGMCMEFAIGSVAKVLGPAFAVVDTYPVRVRLPDEPLMLVDRITSVEGEKGSLGSGRVVTEHDVLPGAWYLDGGCAPVCITVEAGQADLFLCAYLGIDLAVKGERAYRLLDATVQFHRGLPRAGDIIRYDIKIEKFVRQGETYLFFFSFEGTIDGTPLITMTDGCAGFFTEEEIRNSGGIILTEEEREPRQGKTTSDWETLIPVSAERYDDAALEALRSGNPSRCFGPFFEGITLAESIRLPGGRMRLIDRVLLLDPEGGRYGLGIVRAEADIHPQDWFLTCHFMDDMVMPGTLMYECCAHTLRVFIQRLGWVTDKPGVCYEPVRGVQSVLKCRGPVTPNTRHVHYQVEIKEMGYGPEPYVIADALMYADGRCIVKFYDMAIKMSGLTRQEIESFWDPKGRTSARREVSAKPVNRSQSPGPSITEPLFDRAKILSFATGRPSEAFGEPYKPFDQERRIARLPGPPYSFMDRVTVVQPEAWVLKPDGWVEAEYDVHPDAWYFSAERTASMPFSVLLEMALQPCGWLAAYMGSALRSTKDLKFRNLGGEAVLHRHVPPCETTLTMRTRMTKASEAGEMIIEHFEMQILDAGRMVYEGTTYFGFFTEAALAQQMGIREAAKQAYIPEPDELARGRSHRFDDAAPLSPQDPRVDPAAPLAMPAKALRMIDAVETYVPDGGPHGLGFIRGVKRVDPHEWFFKAHFYQDPVCPGSLGIESFLQLIKFMALQRWGHLADSHRFAFVTEKPHHWIYRGQIVPTNRKIEVEAVVTHVQEEPLPLLEASGFSKVDGLYIYQMENFGIKLVPMSGIKD